MLEYPKSNKANTQLCISILYFLTKDIYILKILGKDNPSRVHASDTLTIQPETGTSTSYTGIPHTDVPGDASVKNITTPIAEVTGASIILNLEKNYIMNSHLLM